jgi:hypothetical protein
MEKASSFRPRVFISRAWLAAVIILSIGLGFASTYAHVITQKDEFAYLSSTQMYRHQMFVNNTSYSPWQYRVVGEVASTIFLRVFDLIGRSSTAAFFCLGMLQSSLIFFLAFIFFRLLGIESTLSVVLISVIAWGIQNGNYHSGMAYDTYFDVIFYLTGAILIVLQKWVWAIPLMLLGSLNRETFGCYALILLLCGVQIKPIGIRNRKAFITGLICLAVYAAVFVGVRLYFGPHNSFDPYKHKIGLDMVLFNLTDQKSYYYLFFTLGLFPLALVFWKRWPELLRIFAVAILPIWIVIHLVFGAVFETRLFFVPLILILLPATGLIIQESIRKSQNLPAVSSMQ